MYLSPFSVFLGEFCSFLSLAATTPHEFIITGDFNLHLDNPSDHFTCQFLSVLHLTFLCMHNFSVPTIFNKRTLMCNSGDDLPCILISVYEEPMRCPGRRGLNPVMQIPIARSKMACQMNSGRKSCFHRTIVYNWGLTQLSFDMHHVYWLTNGWALC